MAVSTVLAVPGSCGLGVNGDGGGRRLTRDANVLGTVRELVEMEESSACGGSRPLDLMVYMRGDDLRWIIVPERCLVI